MKTIKMVVMAILAMVFAFPAMAADQPKQQHVQKQQVQRVSTDNQHGIKENPYLKEYFNGLACSGDCQKPKPKVKASSFNEMYNFMRK